LFNAKNWQPWVFSAVASKHPGEGMMVSPPDLAFPATPPVVYVSIESQNELSVYPRAAEIGLSRDPIFMKETLANPSAPR